MYVPNLMEYEGYDLELFFATEVLKLPSLHYGYWPEGSRCTGLEDLRAAQARFSDELLQLVPPGVSTALDVGAGVGDNARRLAGRGIEVVALSPDRNHAAYYPAQDRRVTFHRARFEDFQHPASFDLVLLCESHNYIQPDACLRQCLRYLRPGGHLLVAGIFTSAAGFPEDHCVRQLELVSRLSSHGLVLRESRDVTLNVLPTVEIGWQALSSYARPTMQLAERFLRGSSPWKYWLLKILFWRQLAQLGKMLRYYEGRSHPDTFRRHKRYAFLLFSRPR